MKRLTTISPAKKAARRERQAPRVNPDRSSVFSATLHSFASPPSLPRSISTRGARQDGGKRYEALLLARKEAENTPLLVTSP